MKRITFSVDAMKRIAIFESLTKTHVIDCIDEGNYIYFIIQEGELPKAIGKGGHFVRRIEKLLNRKVRIAEYSPDVLHFVQNLISPLKIKKIEQNNGTIKIVPFDLPTRGKLIGSAAKNLKRLERIIKRHFDIKEIKVI